MITFHNIGLVYEKKQIFHGLSFGVSAGEKVVVAGKSGSGKSSLLHLILGFIQAQEGEIFFDGMPVNETSVWDVRRRTAFVDQGISIGPGRVSEWIRSVFALKANTASMASGGIDLRAGTPAEGVTVFHENEADWIFQDQMDALLDYFELGRDTLNNNVEDLSGGERQRVAIVVSVLLKRKVFLFDEITSALDRRLKEKVVAFFTRRPEWTVIVISHDSAWLNHPGVRVFDLEAQTWKL